MKRTQQLLLLTILPLFFVACTGLESPQPTGGGEPQPDKVGASMVDDSRIEPDADARELGRALEARTSGQGALDDVFLEAECYDGDVFRSLVVFGDGLAIWDGHVQFEVGDDEIHTMLEALKGVDFTTMKPLYGRSAMRIICRVNVEIGDVSKQVAQRQRGEHNETLKKLANDFFDLCRSAAQNGLVVTDLADGLGKIAGGQLSPRTFGLTVHRKPERTTPTPGEDPGWLMHVDDSRVNTRAYESGRLGEVIELGLGDAEVIELANLIAGQGIVELPQNLYAPQYTDVIVRVLKYESRVQARQFAGMTPETHGAQQERFDRLFEVFRDLHERAIRIGSPSF